MGAMLAPALLAERESGGSLPAWASGRGDLAGCGRCLRNIVVSLFDLLALDPIDRDSDSAKLFKVRDTGVLSGCRRR